MSALAHLERQGGQVGLYESALSLSMLPAGLIGGVLWSLLGPWPTFSLALLTVLAGYAVYWFAGPGEIQDQESLQ